MYPLEHSICETNLDIGFNEIYVFVNKSFKNSIQLRFFFGTRNKRNNRLFLKTRAIKGKLNS